MHHDRIKVKIIYNFQEYYCLAIYELSNFLFMQLFRWSSAGLRWYPRQNFCYPKGEFKAVDNTAEFCRVFCCVANFTQFQYKIINWISWTINTHFIKSSLTLMDFSAFLPYSKTEPIKRTYCVAHQCWSSWMLFFGALPVDARHSKRLYHVFLQDPLQLQSKSLHLKLSAHSHLACSTDFLVFHSCLQRSNLLF